MYIHTYIHTYIYTCLAHPSAFDAAPLPSSRMTMNIIIVIMSCIIKY